MIKNTNIILIKYLEKGLLCITKDSGFKYYPVWLKLNL